jgi:hypothetical protein
MKGWMQESDLEIFAEIGMLVRYNSKAISGMKRTVR